MKLLKRSVKASLLTIWIAYLVLTLLYSALVTVITLAIGHPESPLALQGYAYGLGAMTCLVVTGLVLVHSEVKA